MASVVLVRLASFTVLGLALAGCASGGPDLGAPGGDRGDCADVVAVEATHGADGNFTFAVTVRSADTGWEKYADDWEVVSPDGSVLGRRLLLHPHQGEQPFTRSLTGVAVPAGIDRVTVRAGDSVLGFCGESMAVDLHR